MLLPSGLLFQRFTENLSLFAPEESDVRRQLEIAR